MHCSANIGAGGDTALFFGLSGTGKTTLSSDPRAAVSSATTSTAGAIAASSTSKAGCYAKMIRLSDEAEPQIYATTRRFGTVLENVVMDPESRALESRRRVADGEYARRVSDRVHRQPRAVGHGRTSREHRDAHGRRVWRAAADRAALARGRDVSLPVRIHGEGRRHGEGRQGSVGDVQHLFRRAVPAPQSKCLRARAGRAHRALPGAGLAGQYRLDGRPVRRGQAHEDRAHARHDSRGALRRAGRGRVSAASDLQSRHAGELPGRAGRRPRSAQHLEGQGGLRYAGEEAGRDVHRELQDLRGGRRSRRRHSRTADSSRVHV